MINITAINPIENQNIVNVDFFLKEREYRATINTITFKSKLVVDINYQEKTLKPSELQKLQSLVKNHFAIKKEEG